MPNLFSGEYSCDDGGDYWVGIQGNKVYWSGTKQENPTTLLYSNVFVGTMSRDGNSFSGDWGYLPNGQLHTGGGTITLKIDSPGIFEKETSTGGLGGNKWTWQE